MAARSMNAKRSTLLIYVFGTLLDELHVHSEHYQLLFGHYVVQITT